jgi:hypothetical protein
MKTFKYGIIILFAIILVAIFIKYSGKKPEQKTFDDSLIPSLAELEAKGYDANEAEMIIEALKAGKDINY